MKTIYKKASHLRSHTWKDIGGVGGLLLDAAFFVFLLIMSMFVMTVGAIAVVIDYIGSPFLALLSLGHRTHKPVSTSAADITNVEP